MNQFTIAVVQTQQQGTKVFPRTFRGRESNNDKMIRLLSLDLDPVAGTRLLIRAFPMLRDNPFKSHLRNRVEEIFSSSLNVIVVANPTAIVGDQLSQNRLPLLQWKT